MPELPTVAESGLPGFAASSWYGLLGPARLPPDIPPTLNSEINAITAMPDVCQRLLRDGAEPLSGTPQEFARVISDGAALWADVVRQRGIRVE